MPGVRCALLACGLAMVVPAPATAQRLPTTVVPDHYDLAFDVDLARARFDGVETVRVRLLESSARIVLHAVGLDFQEVTVISGGKVLSASVSLEPRTETATLALPEALPAGPAAIRLRYAGRIGDALRGFYLSRAGGRRYAVTQFESTDARRAFAAFDEPAFKATFAIAATVDRRDTAISNGRLLSDTPGPRGRHTLRFAETAAMSPYLVALAVGDFRCLSGSGSAIPLRVCTTRDKRDLGRVALDAAQQILGYYDGYFSIKYPFGKLDLVGIPDFAAGGMENTAAIFIREADLVADPRLASTATLKRIWSLVAHEIAHQWFGNLVTMRWWDDLWLSEGFATWMEKKPLAAIKPEWNIPVDEAAETETAIRTDSLVSTRAIRSAVETPDEIEETFDSIAYEKGAALLRMIEGYVGAEPFRRAVNVYLERYAFGTVTSDAFGAVVTEVTGKPVDRILASFLSQPGVPLVHYESECANGRAQAASGRAEATLSQDRFLFRPATSDGARVAWTLPVCTRTSDQRAACTLLDASRAANLPLRCTAWTFLNAGALGYYRTEYPPAMLRALAADVGSQLTAGERLSLVANEWALVREGRRSAADFLTLSAGFSAERSSAVLAELARHLDYVHDYLTTEGTRSLYEGFVRTLLRPLFSDLGLVAASGDNDERRALRAVVIEALGGAGNDRDLAAIAREALRRSLAGTTTLDPNAADATIRVAVRHGDPQLWDAVLAAAQRATSSTARDRYLNALSFFEDPALVERGLAQALSPSFRGQDAGVYLARFLGNPATGGQAWRFVKRQWTALEPKLVAGTVSARLFESIGSFCEEPLRDDVRSFFAVHSLPAASRALDQALERIDGCIATRRQQTPSLTDWLSLRTKF